MIGTWRWNVFLGSFTMLLTFLVSLSNNMVTTALVRCVYGFIVVFVVTYIIRWMLGTLAGLNYFADQSQMEPSDTGLTGNAINLQTPDDDSSLNDLIKNQLNTTDSELKFSPLQPPKLVSMDNLDSESLANSLRKLSED